MVEVAEVEGVDNLRAEPRQARGQDDDLISATPTWVAHLGDAVEPGEAEGHALEG